MCWIESKEYIFVVCFGFMFKNGENLFSALSVYAVSIFYKMANCI